MSMSRRELEQIRRGKRRQTELRGGREERDTFDALEPGYLSE